MISHVQFKVLTVAVNGYMSTHLDLSFVIFEIGNVLNSHLLHIRHLKNLHVCEVKFYIVVVSGLFNNCFTIYS